MNVIYYIYILIILIECMNAKKTKGGRTPLGINRAIFRSKNTIKPLCGPKQTELGITEEREKLIEAVKLKIERRKKNLERTILLRASKKDDKKLNVIELNVDSKEDVKDNVIKISKKVNVPIINSVGVSDSVIIEKEIESDINSSNNKKSRLLKLFKLRRNK